MYNQTSSSNSEFKMPQAPQPQRVQSESLLFNDILEEINTAIRNQLSDFLQVQPYRVFNIELSNFFKRIDRLKQEAQQNGTNISRLTNCSQMVLSNSRPSSSFRAPSTMSLISCNRNNTIRQSESNFRPIPLNPFKPPVNIGLKSNEVMLPQSNQSNYVSQRSSNMYTTIVEVSHINDDAANINDNHEHLNPSETVLKCPSDPKDTYSDMTIVVENKSPSASYQNENINNDSNSIDSLLESVGFKINVGLPDNSKTTKSNVNGNNGKLEKYLSKWSINMKIIPSKKPCALLTGTLLEADRLTVTEEKHNAGFIICRKEKDLLKTNNGMYRLIGEIMGGSPDELYQECLSKNGIPMRWRTIIGKYSNVNKNVNKGTKKASLNFSLDSPAAPIPSMKPAKKPVNLDMSMTRAGKIYSHNIVPLKKRMKLDDAVSGKSKTNFTTFNRKLPLLASTPKRPKKQHVLYETPTQILKKKLHQNIHQKTNSRTLKKIDDSIYVTRKRRSYSNEQAGKLLKQKSPIKTPQSMSSASNTKSSTKSSILQQSSLKLSINSTKSSKNPTPLSERNEKAKNKIKPVKTKSAKNINIVKPNISYNELKKKIDCSTSLKEQAVKKREKVKRANDPGSGIFGDINFDSFEDSNMNMNVMLSPGKLSVVSGSEKSRCETPPLFGYQWNSTTKSLVVSEPPTPLGKLVEAKALKRVNPPKITEDEEIKKIKKINKLNKSLDFATASKKINKLLQLERQDDEY